ncbi:hypothetical protein BU16DRAFT_90474 [Lophium mytilinum]|uniref:Uncharacterized protein n=1 Tax=Lophium mytilinum TaxID=390894 RepID=A0A6A6QKB8_9PEZI|nr:hypothetical protein BU16DRAFT_90474 [Lophium mytilinum]
MSASTPTSGEPRVVDWTGWRGPDCCLGSAAVAEIVDASFRRRTGLTQPAGSSAVQHSYRSRCPRKPARRDAVPDRVSTPNYLRRHGCATSRGTLEAARGFEAFRYLFRTRPLLTSAGSDAILCSSALTNQHAYGTIRRASLTGLHQSPEKAALRRLSVRIAPLRTNRAHKSADVACKLVWLQYAQLGRWRPDDIPLVWRSTCDVRRDVLDCCHSPHFRPSPVTCA